MIEAFEVIEPSIENDARKAGLRKILKPRKTDPKTGRVEFYLGVEELDEEKFPANIVDAKKYGNHLIHYERVKNPKPSILGRFFSNIVMDKPRAFIYSAFPITLFLFLMGWSIWIVNDDDQVLTTAFVMICIYSLCGAYVFRAFYQIRDKMIIKAPSWMTKYFQGADTIEHAQLEFVLSNNVNSGDDPIVAISLVVYGSTCSICNRPVFVDKGVGKFKGRLIGKCAYSPVEHIFSFDHVTRKGVPLRNDIYIG